MPEQTNHSRPRAHNLLDEEERFPPLPPRDYVGRRPLQALVNRPMFRPQTQMAWQNENTPPNRESPNRQSPDRQNQRRQPNQYRPRLSQNPVDVQIRHFREEVEELLMSVRSMQRAIRNLEIACANRFIGRQHVRSPNASE